MRRIDVIHRDRAGQALMDQRQALAFAAIRQSGIAVGHRRGEHLVHATVDAGIHPRDRRSLGCKPRHFGIVSLLSFMQGVGDIIRHHIGRTFGRGLEHRLAGRIRRLDGIKHVFLFAEIDLRLLLGHLEKVAAFLDHPPRTACSDCCGAWPCSPPSSGTDRLGTGRRAGRRRMIRVPASRFPRSVRRSWRSSRATSSRRAPSAPSQCAPAPGRTHSGSRC